MVAACALANWAVMMRQENFRGRISHAPTAPQPDPTDQVRGLKAHVLAAVKTGARRLRRWPAASLDRGCERCHSEPRSGRRNRR
jgi:hypothetical protein